jgi:hypothetical protein
LRKNGGYGFPAFAGTTVEGHAQLSRRAQ